MDHVLRLGAALTVLALLVPGCGAEGDPNPAPDPSPTTGESPSGSSSPTESESGSESSATPASGKLMRLPGASMRAPENWPVEKDTVILNWSARDPEAYWNIALYQVNGTVTSLDELIGLGTLKDFKGEPEISYDVELGGEPAFRATGKDALGPYVEYGAVLNGVGVSVELGADDSIPVKERLRIEESVLASFEWR